MTSSMSMEDMVVEGRRLLEERQWEAAFIVFVDALRHGEGLYGEAGPELFECLAGLCHVSRMRAYAGVGDVQAAIDHGERALRILSPEPPATARSIENIHATVASAYLAQHRESEALRHLELALKSAELRSAGWFRLGGILSKMVDALVGLGRHEEAIATAERHLRIETEQAPADSVTRTVAEAHLGSILLRAGERERAVTHFEHALARLETRPRAHRFRAELVDLLEQARKKEDR
jgi:tetratricopeptide (TPR) repeat protein